MLHGGSGILGRQIGGQADIHIIHLIFFRHWGQFLQGLQAAIIGHVIIHDFAARLKIHSHSAGHHQNALAAFLVRLAAHKPASRPPLRASRSAEMYQELIETMKAGVAENYSLNDLAKRHAISVSAVKKLFRDYAGIGAMRYYAMLRGQEALRLLTNGKSIEETAEMLNFSSVNYFSLCFKKQFGAPPARYLRERKK